MSNKTSDEKVTKVVLDYRQLRHLPQSAVLEEAGSPRLVLLVVSSVALILCFFIIWAIFTTIDEVASATGEVLPANDIQIVQHLEGGILEEVMVKNGQVVSAGYPLVRFSSEEANAELERMKSRRLSLNFQLMRLQAFLDHKKLMPETLQALQNEFKVSERIETTKMVSDTIQLLALQESARDDDLRILDLKIEQKEEEITKLLDKQKNLNKQIELLKEEQTIYADLHKTEAVSRVTMLGVDRQLNETQGQALTVNSDLAQARQELAEAQRTKEVHISANRRDTLQEIADTNAELIEVTESVRRLQDRVTRLIIKAPVSGIVKGIETNRGSIIPPGGALLELVPKDQELIVEARLSTKDIGHVRVGDLVNVKVATFDFVRYGQITGRVRSISPSTFVNDDGLPYYQVDIDMDKTYVGHNPDRNQLLPGMQVTADIITGNKSVLSYLLKPISRSMQESFHER